MNKHNRFFPVDAIAWGVLLFTLSAQAQEHTTPSLEDRVDQLTQRVDQQQREILSLKHRLLDLEMAQRGRGLTKWDFAQISPSDGSKGDGSASGSTTAAQGGDASNGTNGGGVSAVGQTQQQQRTESEQVRSPSEEAVVQQQHAPLFDHKLTIDTGLSYSYYDRRNLALTGFLALDAIFLGNISIAETKANVWTFDVNARYGLTDRLSVAFDVPYLYRNSDFLSGGAGGASTALSELSKSSANIGDVNATLYYQFVKESTSLPDIVGSLRVTAPTGSSPFGIKLTSAPGNTNLIVPAKLPTGNGIWALTAGLSVLRTYDPIVVFANLAYTYNVPRSFADISTAQNVVQPGTVKLGDIIQFGAGMALALNDKAALSISYSTAISRASKTQAPGESYVTVPGSSTNAASLNLGLNYVINKHWTLNAYFNAGMSPDAPNYVIGIRFPYTF